MDGAETSRALGISLGPVFPVRPNPRAASGSHTSGPLFQKHARERCFWKGCSGIVRVVDLRIAIEVHRLDPPEGSVTCARGATDGEPGGQRLAFAGWLELLLLLQTLVDSERD